MKRKIILEIGKKGTTFDAKVPAGTNVVDIEVGLAQFIIDVAKFRGITSEKFLAEIQGWQRQLEERQ